MRLRLESQLIYFISCWVFWGWRHAGSGLRPSNVAILFLYSFNRRLEIWKIRVLKQELCWRSDRPHLNHFSCAITISSRVDLLDFRADSDLLNAPELQHYRFSSSGTQFSLKKSKSPHFSKRTLLKTWAASLEFFCAHNHEWDSSQFTRFELALWPPSAPPTSAAIVSPPFPSFNKQCQETELFEKKNFVEKIQSYLWHDLISPLIGLLSLFGQVDAGFLEPIISTPDQCIHNSIEWFNSGGRKRNSHGKKNMIQYSISRREGPRALPLWSICILQYSRME